MVKSRFDFGGEEIIPERTIEITHPSDNSIKVGIKVTIISFQDERLEKIKRAIQKRKQWLQQRGKDFEPDEVIENRFKLAHAGMVGWEWTEATYKGTKPDFSNETVKKILTDPKMYWLRDQIEEEISNEKAFFQVSETI